MVLETLSPVERAVFLLHDVFGFNFAEVAETVERSPANTRQIAVRARNHIESRQPRFEPSLERKRELAARFFAAIQHGDVDGLVEILTDDVTMVGNGGGRGAVREPVTGPSGWRGSWSGSGGWRSGRGSCSRESPSTGNLA